MRACLITRLVGPVAQLVEQLTFNQRVTGSNPVRLTTFAKTPGPMVRAFCFGGSPLCASNHADGFLSHRKHIAAPCNGLDQKFRDKLVAKGIPQPLDPRRPCRLVAVRLVAA